MMVRVMHSNAGGFVRHASLPGQCLAFAGLVFASPAWAQSADENTWVTVTAYLPKVDTQVRIAGTGAAEIGTSVDLEDDLDLSDRDVLPAVTAGTRLSHSWRVEGEYFGLSRKGTKSLEREIEFDGAFYPVAARVEGKFSSDIYRLSAGYSFLRKEDVEVGVSLGVHATSFTISLKGDASAGNNSTVVEARKRDVLAPLPTIGVYGSYKVAPKVNLHARVDYFAMKIGDYDGKLLNLRADVAYAVTKTLRLGAEYRKVYYRVGIDKEQYSGVVKYQFSGPAAFATLAF